MCFHNPDWSKKHNIFLVYRDMKNYTGTFYQQNLLKHRYVNNLLITELLLIRALITCLRYIFIQLRVSSCCIVKLSRKCSYSRRLKGYYAPSFNLDWTAVKKYYPNLSLTYFLRRRTVIATTVTVAIALP